MSTSLQGRTAIVTGAGAGLGRAEALALAAAGASVVVNDVSEAASGVVDEIEGLGGKAVLVTGDVAERATADALLSTAIEHLGGLDIVVNNAGLLRDRMLFSMSDDEWDTVLRVHLRGHFLLSRGAAAHWRQRSKADGKPVYGRLVNTASEAFLVGSPGQPNYAAAKAGIAALTVSAARGLARYGVCANAICPRARTGMTEGVFGEAPAEGPDPLSVEHVAPFVAYLASPAAGAISGQVFVVHGGMVALLTPPQVEQRFDTEHGTWTPDELAARVGPYFAGREKDRMFAANEILSLP
ncbi:3-oxoacyl-ACP reductase [Prauserella muralis]|uniref:3-oxoacyl-ACP reductase n=1 Tax=Prauserella muralis TaxID=588067 RepID=A0A2V4AI04_9PSEU|nr:3-oxoacyl-ACP reductase [Prauserella muralis]PXY19545.1 3-oxoacyl-ACP reductase [Prauserella muralis]TWE29536.1 3-oxoacyl-[acyl-carrier protein] reductase [Prauserella muralis]